MHALILSTFCVKIRGIHQVMLESSCFVAFYVMYVLYRVAHKKTEQSIQSIFQDFALRSSFFFPPCWIEHLFLIIVTPWSLKFGWELCILWVISYGLSFSGYARFPEFRDTINDSFSSTCANTYRHSTSYKEISVPMTCLDCKSLSFIYVFIYLFICLF